MTRIQIEPGRWSTPAHVELDEEEIFFVLSGSGLSWQGGKTYQVRAGDCIVHLVATEVHTLYAGEDGLDVLAFGERTNATATYLPRAKVLRMGPTVDASQGPHPWEREAAAGPPDLSEPSRRPTNIVNVDDVPGSWKLLAKQAGSVRTGLNLAIGEPGEDGEPHCHSADEEIFVVLDGEGTLELWGPPKPGSAPATEPKETHPVRRGHVVARPAGTRISHCLRAGADGLTYLAYGTRRPDDVCYYPRDNQVYFRGLGLLTELKPVLLKE